MFTFQSSNVRQRVERSKIYRHKKFGTFLFVRPVLLLKLLCHIKCVALANHVILRLAMTSLRLNDVTASRKMTWLAKATHLSCLKWCRTRIEIESPWIGMRNDLTAVESQSNRSQIAVVVAALQT